MLQLKLRLQLLFVSLRLEELQGAVSVKNSVFIFIYPLCSLLHSKILCVYHVLYRLIAKYRPTMPVLSVVIPRLKTNQLKWSFIGAFEVSGLLFMFLKKEII